MTSSSQNTTHTFTVTGMTCGHCEKAVVQATAFESKATGTASDQATREKLEALGQQRLDTETNEEF